MKIQRILITGANGYLGAQFCQHLTAQGHKVTALCFPIVPNDSTWVNAMEEVLVGSVAEDKTIEMLSERTFDSIIHLVSLDHRQSQVAAIEDVLKVNVQPCWSLLQTFAPKGLKTFLFFSTIHVYGVLPTDIITENQTLAPGNIYALTHAMSEQVVDYYNRTTDVNCLTVRLSNSYGEPVFPENNCWWLAVNDLCKTAYFDKCIKLLSDGSPQRDFIHGSDVSSAVAVLLQQSKKDVERSKFHISSSKTFTLLELAGKVQTVYAEMYGERIPVSTPLELEIKDFDRYTKNPKYSILNNSIRALGFEPQCSIEEGIKRMFHYFENQEHAQI